MKLKPLLYDQLLTSPHISQDIKDDLKQCIVIEATNVSNYYFIGTDQEVWNVGEDFPNVAPPFDNFFLEFRQPQEIISKVHGVQKWPEKAPVQWGVLIQSEEINEDYLPDLATEQGRNYLRENTQTRLNMMQPIMEALDFPSEMAAREQKQSWYNHLSTHDQKNVALYAQGVKLMNCIDEERWNDAMGILQHGTSGMRWILNGYLFAKYRTYSHLLGPHWAWQAPIQENGTFKIEEDEEVNIRHTALGGIENWLRDELNQNRSKGMECFMSAKDECMRFFHTALLAISFMHCKNISLHQQNPPVVQPTPKQKRWGMQPRQLVSYHILDIEPMKQVLKTEGQSDKVGIQRSLHICRGHFAHYDENKKLFGKYAGTFWIPQHVRGNAKIGIAAKDYRIKPVKADIG